MKIKLCLVSIVLAFSFVFVGCQNSNNTNKSKAVNLNESPSFVNEETEMTFVKLPSPPMCKKTCDLDTINKITDFIDSYEKQSIKNDVIGGWELLINVKTEKGLKQYSIVGNVLTIDSNYYTVSDDFIAQLKNLYNEIDAQEEKYIQ